jgi:hypothetical protein
MRRFFAYSVACEVETQKVGQPIPAAAAFQAASCVTLNSLKAKKLQISTGPVQQS